MAGIHPASDGDVMDEYVQALRHDPDAPPPPGLDAQTAAFVRRLVQAESAPARLEPGQYARIWYEALTLAQTTTPHPAPNRLARLFHKPGDPSMFASTQTHPRPGSQLKAPGLLLPFAAALLVVLLAAVISRFSPSVPNPGGGNIPPLGAGDDQAQRATATPTMTATPFPATLPAPMIMMTATPVATFDMATPTPIILPPTLTGFDVVTATPFPRQFILPPTLTGFDVVTATPFPRQFILPPTVIPPGLGMGRAIRMNSTIRDQLTPERQVITYLLPIEREGWVAVTVRPEVPSPDLTLSYAFALLESEDSAPVGGSGASENGSLPAAEIGLFTLPPSGSILSLAVSATNINALGSADYTLSVYQQTSVPVRVGESVRSALLPGQQVAIFVIESTSNQLVDVTVESDGRADLYMNVLEIADDVARELYARIYRAEITGCIQGQPLFCMDQDGGVRRDPELTDVTLLEGARYAIVVRAMEPNAGTEFTLKISPR